MNVLKNYNKTQSFVGYEILSNSTKILDLIKDDKFVSELSDTGYVVLEACPFFPTAKGQVCDLGYMKSDNAKVEIVDVFMQNKIIVLEIKMLDGILQTGATIQTHVTKDRREYIAKQHSCTHIFINLLKYKLGQAISNVSDYVDVDCFRIDFKYKGRLSDQIIMTLEQDMNELLKQDIETRIEVLTQEEALKRNIVINENMNDSIRVVTIGDSVELCEGVHIPTIANIDKLAITKVENKGLNTYRIEATIDKYIEKKLFEEIKPYNDEMLKLLSKVKKVIVLANTENINLDFNYEIDNSAPNSYQDIIFNRNELQGLKEKVKELSKNYIEAKEQKINSELDNFLKVKEVINNKNVIIAIVKGYQIVDLKTLVDNLINKLDQAFILLANVNNNNVNFIAKTKNTNINCGLIVKDLAKKCAGSGNGSLLFAQGGGTTTTNLVEYLEAIKKDLN